MTATSSPNASGMRQYSLVGTGLTRLQRESSIGFTAGPSGDPARARIRSFNEQIRFSLREVRHYKHAALLTGPLTSCILRQRLIPLARRAVLYETSDTRPRLLLLPPRDDWDADGGSPVWAEDLDTDAWVRSPQTASVDELPGTTCYLANGYNIIFQRRRAARGSRGPLNNTVRTLFSLDWLGNIIVIKRARRDRNQAIHITPPEISVINAVVQQCVLSDLLRLSSSDGWLFQYADGYRFRLAPHIRRSLVEGDVVVQKGGTIEDEWSGVRPD